MKVWIVECRNEGCEDWFPCGETWHHTEEEARKAIDTRDDPSTVRVTCYTSDGDCDGK